ncbi:MAG: hypothetical protein HQK96_05585 [Nitrospirae bacterium]|nr:hypothetical protein [Nitrospirota bacterium]
MDIKESSQMSLFGTKSFDLTPPIVEVKKRLRAISKVESVNLQEIIDLEKSGKNRVGITRWLQAVSDKKITIYQDLESFTPNGYDPGEVTSAMQKEIRRGHAITACWWARELFRSPLFRGFGYCWKRLRIVTVEDIGYPGVVIAVGRLFNKFEEDHRIENLFEAVTIAANAKKKTRFFDEVNVYTYFIHDGRIKRDHPVLAEGVSDSPQARLTELEKVIRLGKWFPSVWWAQKVMMSEGVKIKDDCWRMMREIADSIDGKYSELVKILNEQACDNANAEKGLGVWDSVRCALMSAFYLCMFFNGQKYDFDETSDFDEEKISKSFEEFERSKPIIPDYALDAHTIAGKKKGRGNMFWYLVSNKINNKVDLVEDKLMRVLLKAQLEGDKINLTVEEFERSLKSA